MHALRTVLLRVLVGALAWWVVGALPWVARGLRLPVQNLWATDQQPDTMPLVALPFSQYSLSLLLAVTVVGGVAAALTSLIRPDQSHARRAAVAGGALAAVIAITQTTLVVHRGLDLSARAATYLTALVAVASVGSIVGLAVGWALAGRGRAARAVAAAVLAVVTTSWLNALIVTDSVSVGDTQRTLLTVAPWVAGAVAGIGLALCPPRTTRAVLGWVVALAILWVGPALVTAASYVAGSKVLLATSSPSELLEAGLDVFRAAVLPANRAIGPFVLAVLLGLSGLLLRQGVPRAATVEDARTVDS
jgi:hypothetical protein